MKRISIIGCCGAGKSTLSKTLHSISQIPVIHIDQEFWNDGWSPSESEDFKARLNTIYEQDQWIIDGHYISTMDARLLRSDTVYFLDYSTPLCLFRTIKRTLLGYGKVRPDSAEGCPERFDWEFLCYVASFRKSFRSRTLALLQKHPHLNIHTFKNPKELENHLSNLQK